MAALMYQRASAAASSSSDEDEEEFLVCAAVLLGRRKRKRNVCSRCVVLKRQALGAYDQLLQELFMEDGSDAKTFLRMSHKHFQELLQLVGPDMKTEDTVTRESFGPEEMLAITLRFLGSGDSFASLSYLFGVESNTIGKIVLFTCSLLHRKLKDKYLVVPATSKEWETIASEFESRWQLPNCIGALDGKYIQIISPVGESSSQRCHSISLMILVDACYRVIWFSAGYSGKAGNAGVFRESSLAKGIESNTLNLPPPKPLPGRSDPVPFFIVGNDTFGLKSHLMKPFPSHRLPPSAGVDELAEIEKKKRRIFDYRLSRVWQLSENVFGILADRFGVFQKPMRLTPEHATTVTLACLALHNFLVTKQDQQFAPPSLVDGEDCSTREQVRGEWRNTPNCFQPLHQQAGNRSASHARRVRDEIKEYVNAEGEVPWQELCALSRPLLWKCAV